MQRDFFCPTYFRLREEYCISDSIMESINISGEYTFQIKLEVFTNKILCTNFCNGIFSTCIICIFICLGIKYFEHYFSPSRKLFMSLHVVVMVLYTNNQQQYQQILFTLPPISFHGFPGNTFYFTSPHHTFVYPV